MKNEEQTQKFLLRLPEKLYEWVRDYAHDNRKSMNQTLNEAVEVYKKLREAK